MGKRPKKRKWEEDVKIICKMIGKIGERFPGGGTPQEGPDAGGWEVGLREPDAGGGELLPLKSRVQGSRQKTKFQIKIKLKKIKE